MDIKVKRITAGVLCCAVFASGIGIGALASGAKEKSATNTSTVAKNTEVGTDTSTEKSVEKDETVYVIAGADGSAEKIIVSDWIKNATAQTTVTDKSELENIENLKGDETYTLNGDNLKVWDTEGNDIYYQGSIDKDLPVNLQVTYTLDGTNVNAEDLAGKSGKVTVRYDYINNQYETVTIDGKEEKIYVPFAMVTGMILDNDVFKNVTVSNGKLINDGDRTFVAGIALPGLQSNLAIDSEVLTIPDYVEITADVTDFEMSGTVTVATNELFNKIDTAKLDSTDDLSASLSELTTAMDALCDGSSTLYDGIATLLDKSGELISGINKLADGAEKLKNGSKKLNNGATELADGTADLAEGLGELTNNNKDLNAGAKKVFNTLLSTAKTQLTSAGLTVGDLTIENYGKELDKVIKSLDEKTVAKQANATAKKTVTSAVNAKKGDIKSAVTAEVKKQVEATVTATVRENVFEKVLSANGMTKTQYEAGIKSGAITKAQITAIENATDTQMQTDAVMKNVADNVSATMQSDKIKAAITEKTEEQAKALIEQNLNSAEVKNSIATAKQKAKDGIKSVKELKANLDAYNEFYTGLSEYTNGVASAKKGADKLNSGAKELKNGTAELKSGSEELYKGIFSLKDGGKTLKSGVTKLKDGAMTLSDGLNTFNTEGVQKLSDIADGDLASLVTRIKATADVSENYKSFAGIADNMDGQVKFVYRTESIKTE